MNTLHYTDKQLGTFIDKAKKQKWYENTIIIITGDTSWHGESLKKAENFNEFIDIRSQIPLLIVGGPIKNSIVVEEFGSQIDIAPSIVDLLNLPRTTPWMGASLLETSSNSFALTNRPGMYWSVRYQIFHNVFDHFHLDLQINEVFDHFLNGTYPLKT